MDRFDPIAFSANKIDVLMKLKKSVNLISASNISNLQRVPISLRRRAASHNIKRIPSRYRIIQDIASKKKARKICSKYRRSLIKKASIYKRRSKDDKQWLPTHIWHTKRYKMVNKWNWRIPEVPQQKCFRARMKQMRNDCCVMDISYNTILKISGFFNETFTELFRYIGIEKSLELTLKEKLLKSEELLCMLHSIDAYPLSPLCPARIIYFPSSENESKGLFLITVHPIAVKSVTENLKTSFSSLEVDKDLGRFRLIGAKSHEVILKFSNQDYLNSELLDNSILKRSGSCICLNESNFNQKVNSDILQSNDSLLAIRVKYTAAELMHGGWDLLFPIDRARELWLKLVIQLRCYTIGWKYYCRFMSIEYDSLYAILDCFPDVGFPDCPDAMEYKNKIAVSEKKKRKVIRVGKKLQYVSDRTKQQNPYITHWSYIQQDSDSSLCVLRNRVQLHYQIQSILMGKSSDLKFIDSKSTTSLIPVILVNQKGTIEGNCGIYAPLSSDRPNSGPITIKDGVDGRKLIGYTEIGDICQAKSFGKGFGLIALHLIMNHLSNEVGEGHVNRCDNSRFVYVKNLAGYSLVPCFLKVSI